MIKTRGWRRISIATVRWPGPVFVASLVIAIVGIVIMPSMKVSYNDRFYIPRNSVEYRICRRRAPFHAATMNPDILMIESDHDMRNSGDMIILDRLAKDVFRSPGIAMVQSITRPLGGPIEHTSIPFQISAQSIPIRENLQFMKDRTADMLKMSDDLGAMIGSMERMQGLVGQMGKTTHHMVGDMHDMQSTLDEMRDHLADFDDFARPLRSYLYWEQHCFDIPVCSAAKSVFEAMDGVDKFSENMSTLINDMHSVDAILPKCSPSSHPSSRSRSPCRRRCLLCTAVSRAWSRKWTR